MSAIGSNSKPLPKPDPVAMRTTVVELGNENKPPNIKQERAAAIAARKEARAAAFDSNRASVIRERYAALQNS